MPVTIRNPLGLYEVSVLLHIYMVEHTTDMLKLEPTLSSRKFCHA